LKCKEVLNEETNFCFQTNTKYFKPTYMTYEVSKQTFFGLKVLLLLRKTKAYVKRKSKINVKVSLIKNIISLYID